MNSDIIKHLFFHLEKNLDRKLVIFGTGSGANLTISFLGNFFNHIVYFIDNSNKKNKFWGLDVKHPNQLKIEEKKPFVLVASEYYEEIFMQLSLLGYKYEEDFICTVKIIEPKRDYTKNNKLNGVQVGRFTYGYEKHCFKGSVLKSIGSFCSINGSARIGDGNHPYSWITTHPITYMLENETVGKEKVKGIDTIPKKTDLEAILGNQDVVIGNDVWIGANVVVLPGVTVGDGAVIGAGAIVTKDVEPYSIVVGVPGKHIKYRFTEEQRDMLLKIRWWDWNLEKIKEHLDLFRNPNLFFDEYGGLEF